MNTQPLPPDITLSLLRSLGMLLQQAGMYGLHHNVAALALHEAFDQFESALAVYGTIELTKTERALLVNGKPVDTKDPLAHQVAGKISANNLGGLVFKPEMTLEAFTTFAKLFSSSATMLNQLGGMKNAIENAGLDTIATSDTAYKQVPTDSHVAPIAETPPQSAANRTSVIDLTEAFSKAETQSMLNRTPPAASSEAELASIKQKRSNNAEQIANMLRATAALIENEGVLPGELGQKQILASIERILKMVETASQETRTQIAKLAGQVNADRQTIASIESAARRKGIGFNLTRKELLEHYSEINQEMIQPITVASGALDLLLSGKSGNTTPSQKELLKLAQEGIERANQLVEFTKRISGLPESYTPNENLIRDSYS